MITHAHLCALLCPLLLPSHALDASLLCCASLVGGQLEWTWRRFARLGRAHILLWPNACRTLAASAGRQGGTKGDTNCHAVDKR